MTLYFLGEVAMSTVPLSLLFPSPRSTMPLAVIRIGACYMIYAFSEQDASPESIFIRLQFCYFVYYGLYKRGIVLFVGRRTDRGGYLYMGNGHSTALITAEREIGE